MKYIILVPILLIMNGCLYFGEDGISTKLYPNCKEYYDANGNYIKKCPKNLIDYKDLDNL